MIHLHRALDVADALEPRVAVRVFRDFVRAVFAECSERSRALRARRVLWLRGLGQRARSVKMHREGEGE